MTRTQSTTRSSNRPGLSLLEIILALAILGGSLTAIFSLVSVGHRSARRTMLRTDANILVDTKMAEITAGVLPLEGTSGQEIPEAPGWQYAVEVGDSGQIGLFRVSVTVLQSEVDPPFEISVVRFMPDPEFDPEDLEGNQ